MPGKPIDPAQAAVVALMSASIGVRAAQLSLMTLDLAKVGGTFAFLDGNTSEDGKQSSVVMVIAGPIPKDLLDGLGNYCKGLLQDLKSGGNFTEIFDSTREEPPQPE
jgi:hypothetical protein